MATQEYIIAGDGCQWGVLTCLWQLGGAHAGKYWASLSFYFGDFIWSAQFRRLASVPKLPGTFLSSLGI
jgi:hypothetical protein